ncbi:Uncharacterized protein APZ42_019471 [Daphnia magna]|uniref:Uncharacterized protein n=1 Tax=Daphnia magna TaxID=35525 RepID=A0A164Y6B4_9CRUS|nr:Uncharacterized protein APZ42_019471 [Daphnia magna]
MKKPVAIKCRKLVAETNGWPSGTNRDKNQEEEEEEEKQGGIHTYTHTHTQAGRERAIQMNAGGE